jgi:signal transduction histidine kinase
MDRTAVLEQELTELRSEQARMRDELQVAQRLEAVGQLAAGVAHEINTPTQYVMDNTRFFGEAFHDLVGVVQAYEDLRQAVLAGGDAEAALMAVSSARRAADIDFLLEDVPTALEQSMEGLRQVASIVRAMKDFSHPGDATFAPTDLGPVVETAVTLSRNEHKYWADVEVQVAPGLEAVPVREGPLKQVVLNLIVNAAHAVRAHVGDGGRGRIDVRAFATEDGVARIEVQDSGTGIPEAVRDKVFDLFFTTKEVGRGTGQGLALAHRVVREEHGGRLGFETEEGVGTLFWLELPLRR